MQGPHQAPSSVVSNYTFSLACIETGLGSVLHSFRVPLSGQFLSLNQIFFLSRTVLAERKMARVAVLPANMSSVVAVTKSLSPAGKRLTPMLAISMQGILFSIGTILFGVNLLGLLVGAVLSSLWAFVQPLLLSFLFLGVFAGDLIQFFGKEFGKTLAPYQDYFLILVFGAITLKIVLALLMVMMASFISEDSFVKYQQNFLSIGKLRLQLRLARPEEGHWQRVLRELNHPLLWLSLALSFVYIIFNQVSYAQMIWLILRPLAAAFVIIFVIHKLNQKPLIDFLRRHKFYQTASLLEETHKKISSNNL